MRETKPSRRAFLAQSAAGAATAASTAAFLAANAHAGAGADTTIKVGLIGCGGRGTGAAEQALTADSGAKLVAMADAFGDHLEDSLGGLKGGPQGAKVDVPIDRRYVGFDGYKAVIDQADVVLLCTPPAFRPIHLAYAVERGKHAFVEKPVATDAAGVRAVLASCQAAKAKGLSLASGQCWRYHQPRRETMQRVFDGAIGDIVAIETIYNSQGVWEPRKAREECASEMEYQMRNWYYYVWLSGDHIVEQAVHALDTMGWAMGDRPPTRCYGVGGRQVRTDERYGNIYDHFSLVYEYPGDVRGYHQCRHWVRGENRVKDFVLGSKGVCDVFGNSVSGPDAWRYRGPKFDMYQVEHNELFAAIRRGEPLQNVEKAAASTMLALMGRAAAYSGKTVTYDEVLNGQETLVPASFGWNDDVPRTPVPVPGVTRVV